MTAFPAPPNFANRVAASALETVQSRLNREKNSDFIESVEYTVQFDRAQIDALKNLIVKENLPKDKIDYLNDVNTAILDAYKYDENKILDNYCNRLITRERAKYAFKKLEKDYTALSDFTIAEIDRKNKHATKEEKFEIYSELTHPHFIKREEERKKLQDMGDEIFRHEVAAKDYIKLYLNEQDTDAVISAIKTEAQKTASKHPAPDLSSQLPKNIDALLAEAFSHPSTGDTVPNTPKPPSKPGHNLV